jgi:DNA-binding beta-propeller fold protein YncE
MYSRIQWVTLVISIKIDFINFKISNFNEKIGICVNRNTGSIYVSDSEYNAVFKFDSNHQNVTKIGTKHLKWPRSLTYDSSFNNDINSRRLYVCDYSNQSVMIFNEHDQLSDIIKISVSCQNSKSPFSENDSDNFYPMNVSLTQSSIYITDDWNGGNCIRVFDRKTLELKQNIGNRYCYNPLG